MLLLFSNTKKASSAGSGADKGAFAVYLAGAFARKPIKVWNGTTWVAAKGRIWDGTTWKFTYDATAVIIYSVYEDPSDAGTYKGNTLKENSSDPGTFTSLSQPTITENPNDPGTYLILTY